MAPGDFKWWTIQLLLPGIIQVLIAPNMRPYGRPVVVAGFEPVDVMEAILMIIKQFNEGRCEL
ncbi:MAG: hypothetical protein JKY49_03250, partial [Cohaesibacteraceae bacterium]|nr:hypothetical protein [Cohaesibacteraceae bacterium]